MSFLFPRPRRPVHRWWSGPIPALLVAVLSVSVIVLAVARLLVADPPGPGGTRASPPAAPVDPCVELVRQVAASLADPAAPLPPDLPADVGVALDRWRRRSPWPDGETARLVDATVAARCAVPP